jgi:hypothetical protein
MTRVLPLSALVTVALGLGTYSFNGIGFMVFFTCGVGGVVVLM